jgi:hypothetical protein
VYVLNGYAVLEAKRNHAGEARRLFEEAIAVAPGYPNPYLGLAQLALGQHLPLGALQALERLFQRTRSDDVRSGPVYDQARTLYYEASALAAEAERESLMAAVDARLAELSISTGHSIEIREDASLPVRSTVRLAWVHGTDTHTIVHRPTPPAELPHTLLFQLEQIARDHEARRAGKGRVLVGDARTKRVAAAALAGYAKQLAKRGLPEKEVAGFLQKLTDGLVQHLYSVVLEMLVEYRLYRTQPEFRASQFVSLHSGQAENLKILASPSIEETTPPRVFRATVALNAAFALFVDWLLAPRTRYADRYLEHDAFDTGRRIFELWSDRLGTLTAGDEYELVDRVASVLGLDGWYGWRDEAELPEPPRPEGPTNPELLESLEPATVWYCLDALELFSARSDREVEAIAYEIALLGQAGIDYSTSDRQYTLRALPERTFSGLQLLALMYVGFKQTHPELTDIGIDLSGPYETALTLFPRKP